MKDRTPLIAWNNCYAKIDTEYGYIDYIQFCEKEIERLRPMWKKCYIQHRLVGGKNECCVHEKGGRFAKDT